jgi:hypothetical protein
MGTVEIYRQKIRSRGKHLVDNLQGGVLVVLFGGFVIAFVKQIGHCVLYYGLATDGGIGVKIASTHGKERGVKLQRIIDFVPSERIAAITYAAAWALGKCF